MIWAGGKDDLECGVALLSVRGYLETIEETVCQQALRQRKKFT